MYSFTVWSEGGGIGKTSTAQALARHAADQGYETLVVDIDGQKGGLTGYFGLLDSRESSDGEDILDHLAGIAEGPISDLIQTSEGVDVLPSSSRLRDVNKWMTRLPDDPYVRDNPEEGLRELIEQTELYEQYDLMIVDAPGGIEALNSRMALYATRNVLIPFKPNPKGEYNLDGVVENLATYEQAKRIDIGVVGMVPYAVDPKRKVAKEAMDRLQTRLQAYQNQADRNIPIAPVAIGQREALIDNAWNEGHTIVKHVDNESYPAQRNVETIESFELLTKWVLYQLSDGEEGEQIDPTDEFEQMVQQ